MHQTNTSKDKNRMASFEKTNMSNEGPIYPLANSSNTGLQGMNYNDSVNMHATKNEDCLLSSRVSVDPKTAVATGIKISTFIMSALGIPLASQIGQLWNFVLDQLWPNGDNQWEEFMKHVEELINQKITEYARDKALAELEGLGNVLELYQEAIEDWKKDPTNVASQERVRTRFRNADAFFENGMPSFRIKNYEVPLLSVYASAANLHLLLLRDASIYGKDWGLNETNVKDNYNRQLKRTESYSNHCVTWYQKGLQRLKGSDADSWLKFNAFRRDMTFTVLDIVVLFPCYDIQKYPMGVKTEITREIYTDPIGNLPRRPGFQVLDWVNHAPSFEEIEKETTGDPSMVTWINYLEISRNKLGGWNSSNDYWEGHSVHYKYSNDGIVIDSKAYAHGDFSGKFPTEAIHLENCDVYASSSLPVAASNPYGDKASFGVTKVYFDMLNLNDNTLQRGSWDHPKNWGGSWVDLKFLNETPNIKEIQKYSHKLTYVSSFSVDYGSVLCYRWRHSSVDRNNTLDPQKITQISAVKGHTPINCEVVRGNGLTDGDWLQLKGGGSFTLNVSSVIPKTYRIRLRYACGPKDVNLTVSCPDNGIDKTITIPSTSTASLANNLMYKDFKYIDLPIEFITSAAPKRCRINLRLEGVQNTSFFMDKFEFIPENETETRPWKIVTALNNSSVLAFAKNSLYKEAILSNDTGEESQKWRFIYDEEKKAYQIEDVKSPRLILAWIIDGPESRKVWATRSQNIDEHYWILEEQEDSYFIIKNKKNPSLVLDVDGAQTNQGTKIKVNERHPLYSSRTNAQKFKLERV
ncbi:insecticidal delta-endotoxin Cry8Ea1 family protein [Bacillus thuringiensis]|nr:insecticidal delta-endotoxin Cry8Ea1 family protein [Bacillus thuringiensis]